MRKGEVHGRARVWWLRSLAAIPLALAALAWACENEVRPRLAPSEPRQPAVGAPFDLSAIVRQVRGAFRPDGSGFTAERETFLARASKDDFSVAPYHFKAEGERSRHRRARGQLIEGAPAVFAVTAIQRGATKLRASGEGRIEADGSVSFASPGLVHRLESREEGVEHRFVLAAAPAGTGDLSFHLRVTGQRYLGRTEGGHHFADPKTGLGVRYGSATWVDAGGKPTPVQARWTGAELWLTVPAAVLEQSSFPATLDPLVTPEFGMDNPVLGPGAQDQAEPSGAFDGTNWLVVWHDWRRGLNTDIFAARVRPDGTLIDSNGFAVTGAPGFEYSPDVAYDGTNFLVTWTDDRNAATGFDIYAARVSTAGAVLNELAVSTAADDQDYSRVAFGGGTYLVVWEDLRGGVDTDVYGARVTTAGAVSDATGIAISTAASYQFEPSVAFGAGNFFVAWYDLRNFAITNSDIYGSRVSTAGSVLNPAGLLISNAANAQIEPDVAFDNTNFLVVWEDLRGGATTDIYGARVSGAGALLDAAGVSISLAAGDQSSPSVAFDGTNYLVAWEDLRGGTTTNLYGQRVSTGLAAVGAELVLSTAASNQLWPRAIGGGPDVLVVWGDLRDGLSSGSDIYGTRVSTGGTVRDPTGLSISRSANDQFSPAVAFGSNRFLVVWEDSRTTAGSQTDIYGARVDLSGNVLDAAGIAVSTAAGHQLLPSVAFNGTDFLVVWQDNRSGVDRDIYGQRVSAAGTLVGTAIAVSTASDDQRTPSVASDGTGWFVAWEDDRTVLFTATDVYGARVSATGTVLDATGVALSSNVASQLLPSVAFDATNYLVVWTDSRNLGTTDFDVYGTRVSAGGSVLNAAGIPISQASNAQVNATVSFGGGNYLVVWADCRNDVPTCATNADIYGARVSPAGTVLDAAGRTISTAAGNQLFPKGAYDGRNFVVAWEDGRNAATAKLDLYAARVDGTGAVLDATGVGISTGPTDEESGAIASDGAGRSLVSYSTFDSSAAVQSVRVRSRFFLDQANGKPCPQPSACVSGFCVNGVCCNNACNAGPCMACAQDAGAAVDGTCGLLPGASVCRGAADVCDVAESCTGADAGCPPDVLRPATDVCRPASGVCDLAETCTGNDAGCPADSFRPSTDLCRAAADLCDLAETCSGSGAGCPADSLRPATDVCRPANGLCDVAETCTGNDAGCPGDSFKPSTDVCRAATFACDLPETCPGNDAGCPADSLRPATYVCRAAADLCDLAETCTGNDAGCPPDALRPSTDVCRPAAGACDLAESCDGTGAGCPVETFRPATFVCRPAAGACDVDDFCPGIAAACPADSFKPASDVCRPSAGACDLAETCPGNAGGCPSNSFRPATDICRVAADVCDRAETCPGNDAGCPPDSLRPATDVCRPSAGACDLAETCTGAASSCPADSFRSAAFVCRPAAGACDVDDFCPGNSAGCTADAFKPPSDLCRPASGACDVAESCPGNAAGCPADGFKPATDVCRSAVGVCDAVETCTGFAAACPAESMRPATDVCRPAAGLCDVAETCTGNDAGCPTDGFKLAGEVCRAVAGSCDVAESCSGTDAGCPTDGFKPPGEVCRAAANTCDVAESCSSDAGAFCPPDRSAPDGTACETGFCGAGVCLADAGADGGAFDGGSTTDAGSVTDAGQADGGRGRLMPYVGWSCGCNSGDGLGVGSGLLLLLLLAAPGYASSPRGRRPAGGRRKSWLALWASALALAPSAGWAAEPAGRDVKVRAIEARDDSARPAGDDSLEASETIVEHPPAPLHLKASVVGDPFVRATGAEVEGSFSALPNLDVGAAATLGQAVGARLTVKLHPSSPLGAGIRPFLQLRGIFHPVNGGFGTGGGAWLGATVEAGPGRVIAGAIGELYAGPAGYVPYSLMMGAGYELDFLRPPPFKRAAVSRRVERQEQSRPTASTLRGKVTDLEDKPLQGVVRIPGLGGSGERVYEAAPEYEVVLAPGDYHVEAEAPGYLVRGRNFQLKAGETVVHDFQLRPIPAVKSAELTSERIEIKQRIQFAFDAAEILTASHHILDEVVDILLRNASLKIRIEGHTDEVGTAEYNQGLSERRAAAVRAYLLDKGVAADRLSSAGFGLSRPIASNKTEEGRAKNRRVQFEIAP
ncbi:MAG: OmpA family protein [Myxococcales bacterium]|nr:OmpA family protein [Myxococcales bacterium]